MRFEKYFEPVEINECCKILKEYGSDAKILAGGTDIVPRLKDKTCKPKAVVSVWNIPELKKVEISDAGLELGAAVTLCEISNSIELDKDYKVIKEAAGNVSSMQVRNVATIGGNACNASPSADAIQGLMLMEAKAVIVGETGTREVAIEEFFTGPGKTVLGNDEVLASFKVAAPKPNSGAVYKKFAIRGDTDISIVGAGCKLVLSDDGVVEDCIISLAAVASTPIRVSEAEKFLIGKKLSPEVIAQGAEMAAEACAPISDQRASAEYRKEMVNVWTRHAIQDAEARAKGN